MTGKQALEYREPRQVEYVDTQFGKVAKCPRCGVKFLTAYGEAKFCSHCGQALSFEEVETNG